MPHSSFVDALVAAAPAADRTDGLALYAFLIGQWQMDAVYHLDDGGIRRSRGEIHAAWVLGGRAIQDVWIVPLRDGSAQKPPDGGDFYGTTLRVYDPAQDAWHIVWSDPLHQLYVRQIARKQGDEIVQEGTTAAGIRTRWRFTDITPDQFHWWGERWDEGAATWRLRTEYIARRVASG